MKKLGLVGVLAIIVVIAVAVATAGRMGETSHAFARGKIVLSSDLTDAAKGITTLFIIATGPDRPMPLGAYRATLRSDAEGEFYDFVLTKDNMQRMMGEEPFPPEFKLKARLDRDGAAGPDQPGDLTGEVYPVKLGQTGVEIHIDKRIP